MEEQKKTEECCEKDEKSCKCGGHSCCGCKVAIAVILFLLGAVIGYLKGTNSGKCKSGCGMRGQMTGQMMPPPPHQPAGK
ncbi:MAG TPA: hypothetical protein DCM05_13765 [Elusimicrobia bacterium]|nr:hypothetical protein [Elusimicrobiota bacterium]